MGGSEFIIKTSRTSVPQVVVNLYLVGVVFSQIVVDLLFYYQGLTGYEWIRILPVSIFSLLLVVYIRNYSHVLIWLFFSIVYAIYSAVFVQAENLGFAQSFVDWVRLFVYFFPLLIIKGIDQSFLEKIDYEGVVRFFVFLCVVELIFLIYIQTEMVWVKLNSSAFLQAFILIIFAVGVRRNSILVYLFLALLVFYLDISAKRNSLYAVAVIVLCIPFVYFFLYLVRRLKASLMDFLGLVFAFVFLVGFLAFFLIGLEALDFSKDQSLEGRLYEVFNILNYFESNPWEVFLGFGFGASIPQVYFTGLMDSIGGMHHIHSSFVLFFGRYGILGLLLMLLVFFDLVSKGVFLYRAGFVRMGLLAVMLCLYIFSQAVKSNVFHESTLFLHLLVYMFYKSVINKPD